MTYTPENLNLWALPDSYFGAEWPEYYVFLGRHRESDLLTQDNFEEGLKAIGGANGDTVQVIRESHWAVGWVEWIAIHESNSEVLQEADSIVAALEDYPVLNEGTFSERECEAADYGWNNYYSLREKIDMCKGSGLSIFAARCKHIPQGDDGSIFERCLGY